MKRTLTLTLAITTLMFVFIGQAADWRWQVVVGVNCDDENTKTFIESHIKRELRALQDIDLVEADDAEFFLHIIAIEGTFKATGRKTGTIAVAYAFWGRNPVLENIKDHIPAHLKGMQELVESEKRNVFTAPTLAVATDDTVDLEQICKTIVVDFDTQLVEQKRKLFQKFKEGGLK